jgi:hypothetical protein
VLLLSPPELLCCMTLTLSRSPKPPNYADGPAPHWQQQLPSGNTVGHVTQRLRAAVAALQPVSDVESLLQH